LTTKLSYICHNHIIYEKQTHCISSILVRFCYTFFFATSRQYKNHKWLRCFGGLTQFDIATDNFETKAGNGWVGGFTATVDLPHRWYAVSYSMQLSESNLEISGRELPISSTSEMMEYKLMTVQAAFLFHLKIVKNNITLDAGPMLQYNGELELKDDAQESYIIDGYSALMANEISDISKFNLNGAIGATAGFENFKIRAQYIYGFTNMLNKLNDQDLSTTPSDEKFKGNQQMIALSAMILF
jgi:hypothetical protein